MVTALGKLRTADTDFATTVKVLQYFGFPSCNKGIVQRDPFLVFLGEPCLTGTRTQINTTG